MRLHRFAHHAPSTNGAPQVIATLFAAMLILTILLPIAEVSLEGSMSPRNLVQLISSEAGFNIFALLLLILPVIGIGEAMLARSAWRGASAVVAFVALALLFLVLFLLDRAVGEMGDGTGNVTPGIGGYIFLIGYLIILTITSIAAFRARGDDLEE
jgi:hypothetical protein